MAFIEMTMDNLNLFLNKLRAFDRYYHYSDDPKALSRGQTQENNIKEYCQNIVFQEIYDLWLEQTATSHGPLDEDDFYKRVLEISAKSLVDVEDLQDEQTIQEVHDETLRNSDVPGIKNNPVLPQLAPLTQSRITKQVARIYLDDDFSSTHYILSRGKDLNRLYPLLKWKETTSSAVVYCDIYECRLTKGFNGPGNPNNSITTPEGVLRYTTENCLLAYLLAAFW